MNSIVFLNIFSLAFYLLASVPLICFLREQIKFKTPNELEGIRIVRKITEMMVFVLLLQFLNFIHLLIDYFCGDSLLGFDDIFLIMLFGGLWVVVNWYSFFQFRKIKNS